MSNYKDGDYVYHKSGNYNKGLGMEVTGTKNGKIRCEWFEGEEAVHKVEWLDENDLVLVRESDGGFRKEGY